MLLTFILLTSVIGQSPRSQCLSEYGRTVCGFSCVANYGVVACARTPLGACKAEYGAVTCWDPSPEVWSEYGPRAPPAECLSKYGKTVCGWGCVANYGEVKCAQTPQGSCAANSGAVHCYDPPLPSSEPRHRRERAAPAATCLSEYGTTVCGYGCVAQYGQVKCARTPGGVCTAQYGKITCFEP